MIDLHTHSNASDGTDSPEQLVEKAHKLGITALALSDHDTLDGLDRAEECARDFSMDFIRGCELSTRTEDKTGNERKLHVLGLWVPRQCRELENFLIQAREQRRARNRQMINKLRNLGFDINLEEVQEMAKGAPGRPHMAQLLMKKAYVHSLDEAFRKYLGSGGKAYVPKESVSTEEAISLLARQGAMVFIAHPLLALCCESSMHFIPWLAGKLPGWRKLGLCGLEAWNSAHGKGWTEYVRNLAAMHELEVTGGSDYHGKAMKNARLGHGGEDQPIPDFVYSRLKEYRKINGYPD